jgi:hypothetical protein
VALIPAAGTTTGGKPANNMISVRRQTARVELCFRLVPPAGRPHLNRLTAVSVEPISDASHNWRHARNLLDNSTITG